ncbi:MAG: hypothetical protein WD021_11130 [Rhodothermales bacterium]
MTRDEGGELRLFAAGVMSRVLVQARNDVQREGSVVRAVPEA